MCSAATTRTVNWLALRQLGIVANFQPLWAFADPYIVQLTLPQLGAQRSRWLYPIGSDWNVTSLNPLDAIQVAFTRRGLDQPAGDVWIPEEKIDLPAILAPTRSSART